MMERCGMKIEREEIDNLENAINAAVKQTGLIVLLAASTPNEIPGMGVTDILRNMLVYNDALNTIKKLREGQ